MRQYSIDHVEANWFGLSLKEGYAVGSAITEARTTPSWTNKPTGQGKVVRVYNPDRSGTISFLIDQESQTQANLTALAITDRVSRNVVGTMVVWDTTSGDIFYYKNAYIATDPDMVRATDSSVFTWVFNFESVEHVPPTAAALDFVGS